MTKVCQTCNKEKHHADFYAYHANPNRLRPHCKQCQGLKRQSRDWQGWKQGWPYKGDIDDMEYLKDRAETFMENGNGWWWGQG